MAQNFRALADRLTEFILAQKRAERNIAQEIIQLRNELHDGAIKITRFYTDGADRARYISLLCAFEREYAKGRDEFDRLAKKFRFSL